MNYHTARLQAEPGLSTPFVVLDGGDYASRLPAVEDATLQGPPEADGAFLARVDFDELGRPLRVAIPRTAYAAKHLGVIGAGHLARLKAQAANLGDPELGLSKKFWRRQARKAKNVGRQIKNVIKNSARIVGGALTGNIDMMTRGVKGHADGIADKIKEASNLTKTIHRAVNKAKPALNSVAKVAPALRVPLRQAVNAISTANDKAAEATADFQAQMAADAAPPSMMDTIKANWIPIAVGSAVVVVGGAVVVNRMRSSQAAIGRRR